METTISDKALDINKSLEHCPAVSADLRTWYPVQCKPRQDERAENNLIRQGYRLPCDRRVRLLRGQRHEVRESLFPGYLFINLPAEANWVPLRLARSVPRIMSFGGKPQVVSGRLVGQRNRRTESELTIEDLCPTHRSSSVGSKLRTLEDSSV